MAAANTDKLKKISRKWVGQVGSGGVADGVVTTIPLASTTNLPTDTAVIATIDRVDANGTITSSLEEAVTGVVSASNLINCIRGVEGTAQAHNAGAVVELLVTAKGLNDIVDWGLVEHNQDGTHKTPIVTLTGTQTFTNKRITKRIESTTSSASPTPNADSYDGYVLTALATDPTFGAPTGTPTENQSLIIRIKDNGVARTLAWNAIYRAMGTALPTTTTISKTLYLGFIYNSTDTKWDLVASAQEA
jgi:hypothetical protein